MTRRYSRLYKYDVPAIYFVGTLTLALSLLFIYQGVSQLILTRSAKSWKRTEGVIKQSWIEPCDLYELKRDCNPKVRYEYIVDGKTFTGSDFYPHGLHPATVFSEAAKVLRKYEPGQQVRVFYNPASPTSAALERRSDWSGATSVIMGGFLVFGSVCMFLAAIRLKSRTSTSFSRKAGANA